MATDQKKIVAYVPQNLAELIDAEMEQENRTQTAIVRRALEVYYDLQKPRRKRGRS